MSRLSQRQGITPQKSVRQPYERDPQAVQHWLDERYPAIRARAQAPRGAHILAGRGVDSLR